jgi:hypothetical protein
MHAQATPRLPCSHRGSCELFPKFALRGALKVWTTFYCDGNHQACERFKRSQRNEPVPPNLLPNGKELDLDLLLRSAP